MSTTGQIALGVVVVAGVGGAFYYVMQKRKAMLAGAVATPAAPTGITSIYNAVAGTYIGDGGLAPVPSIAVVAGQSLPALQAALAAPPGEVTAPTTETRTGRGHF